MFTDRGLEYWTIRELPEATFDNFTASSLISYIENSRLVLQE